MSSKGKRKAKKVIDEVASSNAKLVLLSIRRGMSRSTVSGSRGHGWKLVTWTPSSLRLPLTTFLMRCSGLSFC